MPRKARIDYPGRVLDLIIRGITTDTIGGESGGERRGAGIIDKRHLKLKD